MIGGRAIIAFVAIVVGASTMLHAQTTQRSVKETLAQLPALMKLDDGSPVTTTAQWREQRRPELLTLFAREMYGQSPPRPAAMTFDVFERNDNALGGKATRRQIAIRFNGRDDARMDLLI